ncbi:MAG: DUF2442 domain-containing protein [Gemmatimonadota bacterium]|nr:DUF2442 domain-containing protein [Gemmatimonadota bacterium]
MDDLIAVVEVRHIRDHLLWLRFSDGATGDVDLANELHGEVFEPLEDVALFARVHVDPELQTVAWPNGADLAPEFLRELVRSRAAA